MKSKKLLLALGTVATVAAPVAAVVSCGGTDADLNIGFTNYQFADTFMQTVQQGIKGQASTAKASLTVGDAKNDATVQMQLTQGQITNGATGLLVNLVEPTNAKDYFDLAKREDLPIVLVNKENKAAMNAAIAAKVNAAYVGSLPSDSGKFQADEIYDDLNAGLIKDRNKDGKIDLLILGGQKNHADAIARSQAVIDELVDKIMKGGVTSTNGFNIPAGKTADEVLKLLKGHGNDAGGDKHSLANALEYVETNGGAPVRWSVEGGKSTVKAADPDAQNAMDIIIGNNDDTALGASDYYFGDNAASFKPLASSAAISKYINSADVNYMPVYGIDANDGGINAIKQGKLAGTIKQDGNAMGRVAFQAIQDLVEGKTLTAALLKSQTNVEVTKDADSMSFRVAYTKMSRKLAAPTQF